MSDVFIGPDLYIRQYECAWDRRISIATFGVNTNSPTMDILRACRFARILIGTISSRPGANVEQQGTNLELFANICATVFPRKTELRVLEGCHAKLFMWHTPSLGAILGSSNLGGGAEFELGLEVSRDQARGLRSAFENLWKLGVPLKGFDSSQFKVTRKQNA